MIHQRFPSQDEGLSVVRSATPDPVNMAELLPVLRLCAADLGLSPQVLRTLEVLLSFLPPQRNHHIVFASNETLITRAGGLSERSLRRHIEALRDAGLLTRSDSANRKRFTRFDPVEDRVLRFGLDLSPIFAGYGELKARATEAEARLRQLRYLKARLRAAAARLLVVDPDHEAACDALKAARRNITADELKARLETLPAVNDHPALPTANPATHDLSGSDGQIDRHHHSLNKEHLDKDAAETLNLLIELCPEALAFAESPIRTEREALAHARMLAPMMGISVQHFDQAVVRHSAMTITALVWHLLQRGSAVRHPSAYFYAAALGRSIEQLDPIRWFRTGVRKFVRGQMNVDRCPRTIMEAPVAHECVNRTDRLLKKSGAQDGYSSPRPVLL
ncbi:helix-turn-helix domain-containing protein [Falsigemmobacter faecalis]|uniref:Replication protein C n=1 Tax=Falsigemmobacter faecalis TaxID=2488730 RepID=A0A3P3DEQ4_9RHOB|nr:helix-turn-helix domain-containing protein [Falsigemmobacter faecalis]RRH72760.1 replication protein C [Falsigemmobacter faecalis]